MKTQFLGLLIGAFSVVSVYAYGETPSWAKIDTLKRNGDIVTVVCHGTGPSLNVSRQDALNNCQISASQFLNGEMKVTAISVETERNVGFHQEVLQKLNVKNLKCNPKKDEIIKNEEGFHFWLKCEFNLNKVIVDKTSPDEKESDIELKSVSSEKVQNISDKKVLIIEVIPQCDSVLIPGLKAKVADCLRNPTKILLGEEDRILIVRKNGYLPKKISIKDKKNGERISVVLEKN